MNSLSTRGISTNQNLKLQIKISSFVRDWDLEQAEARYKQLMYQTGLSLKYHFGRGQYQFLLINISYRVTSKKGSFSDA